MKNRHKYLFHSETPLQNHKTCFVSHHFLGLPIELNRDLRWFKMANKTGRIKNLSVKHCKKMILVRFDEVNEYGDFHKFNVKNDNFDCKSIIEALVKKYIDKKIRIEITGFIVEPYLEENLYFMQIISPNLSDTDKEKIKTIIEKQLNGTNVRISKFGLITFEVYR